MLVGAACSDVADRRKRQPKRPALTIQQILRPACVLFILLLSSAALAEAPAGPVPNPEPESGPAAKPAESQVVQVLDALWSKVSISTKWYVSYAAGQEDGESFNRTHVGRGYLTFKFKPVKWFESRVTMDTHQDDLGDWKVRLKYLYGRFKIPVETPVVTEPNIELGIAHGPWFDYEEHINGYRAEGKMFLERNSIFNSADLGFTIGGLLGEKLDDDYQKKVSKKYPGKYGSFAFGVYNGGGYHAAEQNEDKVIESRISLRPLGFVLPHWQVSHVLVHGKGNTPEEPDWDLNAFLTSFEHQYFAVTAQLGFGEGNQKGDKLEDDGGAMDLFGYSFFGEVKLPWIQSSLIGRYDYFDWGTDGGKSPTRRIIGGHAFHFLPHNFILASVDFVDHGDAGIPNDQQAKLTLQIKRARHIALLPFTSAHF